MAKLKLLILSIIALSNSISLVAQQTDPAYQYADELIVRLSLEEKISLMMNWPAPIERLDIPSYNWWNEALHGIARAGYAAVFPQAIGMAATFKPQLIQAVFSAISDEGRAKYNAAIKEKGHLDQYEGLTFWTPNINIFRLSKSICALPMTTPALINPCAHLRVQNLNQANHQI
jgi:beta-glucosidase